MLQAGIVGLPNVGKSTLFNAVTRTRKAEAANYPFCTIDPNIGVVSVPDERIAVLSELSGSKKLIPTAIEFVDIAGLVEGASEGAGLGNKFLATIREVDAIAKSGCSVNDSWTAILVDAHHHPKHVAYIAGIFKSVVPGTICTAAWYRPDVTGDIAGQ